MLKVSDLVGLRVRVPKKPKKAKDGTTTERTSKLGKIHMAVFSPDGAQVVGFMVRRPDVVGMVKREDAFLAWDAFGPSDGKAVVVTRPTDGLDAEARKRLLLDWDACIMWAGMDAKTVEGKPLGYVSDAEFDERTGRVTRFFTTDGGVSHALVGSFQITPDMVRGYAHGRMVVDTGGKALEPDGGLAGAAGEGYARAKVKGAEVGKKAGAAAGEAVEKGSFALGKVIGKAQKAISEATKEEPEPQPSQSAPQAPAMAAADVRVEEPVEKLPESAAQRAERPAPKTYAPASEGKPERRKTASAESKTAQPKSKPEPKPAADKAAKAVGKQLGAMGKMFGSFKDEFDKANK
jgi:uncharacterized protein YrrD